MRPIIQSRKHLVQTTPTTTAAGVNTVIELVVAKQDPTDTSATNVPVGAVIKAIYLEYWYTSNSSSVGSAVTSIEKVPGSGDASMANADANTLHTYDNKRGILETHQGLLPTNVGNPIPMFRNWVKIPKGKQRFALNDRLNLNFNSIAEGTKVCGIAIFKSYT